MRRLIFVTALVLVMAGACYAGEGQAPDGVLSELIMDFEAQTSTWQTASIRFAKGLFWNLVLIGFFINFAFLFIVEGPSLERCVGYLVKFCFVTGFFYYLLDNGTQFAKEIIESFTQVGMEASGFDGEFSPSNIMGVGLDAFAMCCSHMKLLSPFVSIAAFISGLVLLLIMGFLAGNMLLMLCCSWLVIYTGIIYLGFGGLNWTWDMVSGYFRSVLGLGFTLLALILLCDVCVDFITGKLKMMDEGDGFSLAGMGLIIGVSLVLFVMVTKAPPMVATISGGAYTGSALFGVGAMMATVSMTHAAVSGGLGLAKGPIGGAIGLAKAVGAAYTAVQKSGYKGGRMGTAGQVAKQMAAGVWAGVGMRSGGGQLAARINKMSENSGGGEIKKPPNSSNNGPEGF